MKKHNVTAIAYDKRNKVLSVGSNSYVKTHPLMFKFGKKVGKPKKIYLHAELDALLKARPHQVYKLVVLRVGKSGKYLNAKPCKICQEIIKLFNVQKIEHS